MENVNFDTLYPENTHFSSIEKLAGFIKEGTSSQVISIPGAGRSTILTLLAVNKKIRDAHFAPDTNIHFVLVNFSEVRKRPLFDVMKFLFLSLSDSLRDKKAAEYEKVNALLRESLGFKDELVLFQALKEAVEYLTIERKLKIAFLFDRFEEYVPTVTSEFFTNLRTLRNKAKFQLSVVFSLTRPLEVLIEPDIFSDFYEFAAGHYIYLGLSDPVTTDFRISHIEKITGKKLKPDLLDALMKETAGVGRLIKLSVEAILSSPEFYSSSEALAKSRSNGSRQARTISEFLFSQKLIKAALREICRSLLPVEQTMLIKEKYDDLETREYLEKVGILKENIIQIPLFAEHIAEHRAEQKGSEKIIYDENIQAIKKGQTILSDQLTSSEFKLLFYLLQNADRIVDRDSIINVVWSSVKSTAGITDQAVDQLIFRLRRKIEDDPNTPVHLLTVKGRGFRFMP